MNNTCLIAVINAAISSGDKLLTFILSSRAQNPVFSVAAVSTVATSAGLGDAIRGLFSDF
jgi:hypothetical protein